MSKSLLTLDNRDVFKPFVNDFIGFENLFNRMNDVFNTESKDNFPPYDIYQEKVKVKEWHPSDILNNEIKDNLRNLGMDVGDNANTKDEWHTFICFALAGFSKEDVRVVFEDNILSVIGDGGRSKEENEEDEKNKDEENKENERKYIRKGIGERRFWVQKTISSDLELVGAKWKDGCLTIEFKPTVKKEKETKFIEIQ